MEEPSGSYKILLAINGMEESQAREVRNALEKYGVCVESLAMKYSKLGVAQHLAENAVDVAILAEYLESASPYGASDYERLADGNEDVLLIPILQDQHKSSHYMGHLFSAGIFQGLFSSDAAPESIAGLIKNKRSRKECKSYYGIREGEARTGFANIGSCIAYIEAAREKEEILRSIGFVKGKIEEREFQAVLNRLDERIQKELRGTEEYGLYFGSGQEKEKKGEEPAFNWIFPKLASFFPRKEKGKKEVLEAPCIQRGIAGTFFVSQLKHGSGCTHFSSTCANVFLSHGCSVGLVHQGENLEGKVLDGVDVLMMENGFASLYPKYRHIIYDGGVYDGMGRELLEECSRAYARIMVCRADEGYLRKLAAFVERQEEAAYGWTYMFNTVPDCDVPYIRHLMSCYETGFLPVYSSLEAPKKLSRMLEKWRIPPLGS